MLLQGRGPAEGGRVEEIAGRERNGGRQILAGKPALLVRSLVMQTCCLPPACYRQTKGLAGDGFLLVSLLLKLDDCPRKVCFACPYLVQEEKDVEKDGFCR